MSLGDHLGDHLGDPHTGMWSTQAEKYRLVVALPHDLLMESIDLVGSSVIPAVSGDHTV